MIEKLKSRKFWLTLAGSVVVLFASSLGFEPEAVAQLVTLLLGYLGVEGAADAIRAIRAKPGATAE